MTTHRGGERRLQARFLSILPRIRLHAEIYFRHVPPGPKRDDAVAEAVGLAWKWYVRLVKRGKDPHRFPSALASYAARAVNCGRRVCGHERAKDVLSPVAQRRHGFVVQFLPAFGTLNGNPLSEALADDSDSPVPDQAAFRIDFPIWLALWDDFNRRLITDLGMGERTKDVSGRYGVSAGRVSQKRQDYRASWLQFHGEQDEPPEQHRRAA